MTEEKTYYITKYWATKGIIKTVGCFKPGSSFSKGSVCVQWINVDGQTFDQYFYSNEWWATKENAIAHVEELRKKKIVDLEKQVKALKQKLFTSADIMDYKDLHKRMK